MKPSEIVPIFNLVAQKFKETGERLTHQELQQLLLERGLSAGNFYQEIEMDSAYVDAHEDISTSRDEVQLHSHTFYELIYCHSGSLDYLVGTQRYRLQRGDIVIIPPGISHARYSWTCSRNRIGGWSFGSVVTLLHRFPGCFPFSSKNQIIIWCAQQALSGKVWSSIFAPRCRKPGKRNWDGKLPW